MLLFSFKILDGGIILTVELPDVVFQRKNLLTGFVDNALLCYAPIFNLVQIAIKNSHYIRRHIIVETDDFGQPVLETINPCVFTKGNYNVSVLIYRTPLVFIILNHCKAGVDG